MRRVLKFSNMCAELLRTAFGKSYFHPKVQCSRHYKKGKLQGYFLDFTPKSLWRGQNDKNGIPLLFGIYRPMVIIQKGLGHYEKYLSNRQEDQKQEFIKLCNFLITRVQPDGGIKELKRKFAYSAMTQGQALSLLTRAAVLTGDERYLSACHKIYVFLISGNWDVMTKESELDELPHSPYRLVLNGWIFSIFGIYDFILLTSDKQAKIKLAKLVSILSASLDKYDTGNWSYYDQSGNIASAFYHRCHILQLELLSELFPKQKILGTMAKRFKIYYSSPRNRLINFFKKSKQKFLFPTDMDI